MGHGQVGVAALLHVVMAPIHGIDCVTAQSHNMMAVPVKYLAIQQNIGTVT